MNKKIKSSLIIFSFVAFTTNVFAQNIELPDVVTVIESDSIKAGLDTLPDFSDVLVVEGNSGNVVPKLPDVENLEDTKATLLTSQNNEKTIFAEGLIGGGYPTLFVGDFSVFRMTGESPFKLEFSYNAENGYAGKPLTDCFYDKNTKLAVEKTFKKNKFGFGAKGLYQSVNDGLQNQVLGISSLNHEVYDVGSNVSYELGKGFVCSANLDLDFYNRYADISTNSVSNATSSSDATGVETVKFPTVAFLNMNPELGISWKGYGANISFNADYLFGSDFKNQISEKNIHRAEFLLDGNWANDIIKIIANAGVVVGNNIGENKVVVPFTVGVESSIPVSYSSKKVTIGASGGIQSIQPTLYKNEIDYKFAASSVMLRETSDWFGKVAISVPCGNSFFLNVDFEYLQTAFNNYLWQPVYETPTIYGFYDYLGQKNQQANSKVGISYHYKFMTINATWNSFWLDVPVLKLQNSLALDLNFQDEKAKWGATLFGEFGFSEEKTTPLLNIEGFARLTPAVRVVLSVNDIVKLLANEQRSYAGNYITRSGNVSALLKFFF